MKQAASDGNVIFIVGERARARALALHTLREMHISM